MIEQLISAVIIAGVTLVSVVIGFLMGWKAARPEHKLIRYDFNPGSTDEPEGDIWQDAMTSEEEKKERGIPTI